MREGFEVEYVLGPFAYGVDSGECDFVSACLDASGYFVEEAFPVGRADFDNEASAFVAHEDVGDHVAVAAARVAVEHVVYLFGEGEFFGEGGVYVFGEALAEARIFFDTAGNPRKSTGQKRKLSS